LSYECTERERSSRRSNVASLAVKFQVSLPAVADSAALLPQSVSTASGIHDLLFVTTKAGHIVALDAQTGTQRKLPIVRRPCARRPSYSVQGTYSKALRSLER